MSSVLEEKDAIRELLARYCFHYDGAEFTAWTDLFTVDCVFDAGPFGRYTGREGLERFLQSVPLVDGLPMVRHCVTNEVIRVEGSRAHARSYVVVVRGGPQLATALAGRYEDQLVKLPGGWRFQERVILFDLLPQQ
jgi:3-phenylpropionate/cinnamic acid dioxygenase small subunit